MAPAKTREGEGALYFDAVLTPNRSLSPRGFAVVMIAIAVVSFAAGVSFLLAGAWPVFGFFGLDVVLIWYALKRSYRAGRLCETVRLTDRALVVQRTHPGGRWERWEFQPAWVRMTVDGSAQDDPRVGLAESGVSVLLGRFLSPEERLDFAAALERAIGRARTAPAV